MSISTGAEVRGSKGPGEVYEGVAFTFCKIATVALLAGRFTLPIAASLAAAFYLTAIVKGKKDTRCWVRYSWVLVFLWSFVAGVSFFSVLHPNWSRTVLDRLMHFL